jgi:flagellin FlaB
MVKYNNNKKGAEGIGTLIIFIALILVAAVAAGVLIQTASSLQSKSLDVGRQSQEKITTDIEIIQVFANDTSDGAISNGTDTITMVVRLGSGSAPISLGDLLVRMDTQSGSQSVTYSGGSAGSTTEYGIDYKINGSNNQAGYLTVGDLAEINFIYDVPSTIVEGETATVRLVAKNGAVKPVQMTTPSAMLDSITYLYP